MSPPRMRMGGIIGIVIAVVLAIGVSCNGFREDEVECEKASVVLRDCCPKISASTFNCTYAEHLDCNDSVLAREYPTLTITDSKCIRRKSCSELVADGDCERIETAKPRLVPLDAAALPRSSTPQGPLCKE